MLIFISSYENLLPMGPRRAYSNSCGDEAAMKFSAITAAIAITLLTVPASAQVQEFAEILAAKSGGKLKVREFAASQLGNEMQMQSALRGGTQEMLSASTTSLASVVKEFGLLDFPFAVSTTAQARHDRRVARERFDRARLLGPGISQRHQQQPIDRESRGLRRTEAARHS